MTRGPTSKFPDYWTSIPLTRDLSVTAVKLNYVLAAGISVDRELLDHCFVHGASGPPRIQALGFTSRSWRSRRLQELARPPRPQNRTPRRLATTKTARHRHF